MPAFREAGNERETAGDAARSMDRSFDELVRAYVGDDRIIRLVNALAGYLGDGSERLSCAQMVDEPAQTRSS